MNLWIIEPIADSDDPRWLDHHMWREVVVRAETVGDALNLARIMDEMKMTDVATVGNESQALTSGLGDEKLYRIKPLNEKDDERGFSTDGEARVLAAA
ncbi:MAG: hypothetical protein JJ855_17785 [Rhodospirillales bacterium]|nr:hypothetical protein [Rhodospirillales bacterium]